MFNIFETDGFVKDLEKELPINSHKIISKLRSYAYPQMRINPFSGTNIKKLKSITPDKWRYRIGDYRFFYEINLEEKIVIMITADHRKNCY